MRIANARVYRPWLTGDEIVRRAMVKDARNRAIGEFVFWALVVGSVFFAVYAVMP